MHLPNTGLTADQIHTALDDAARDDADWRGGRTWSLVYDSPPWHTDLVEAATQRFAHENALSHSTFPSTQRFESQVCRMAASVVCPGVETYGVFTSGGTESIMVAVKAYRDHTGRRGLVMPTTAHPAFVKAAAYLDMEVTRVPVEQDGRPDPERLLAAVTDDTALIALSAPCFPYGVVDPLEEVGALALEQGVGVHVDAAMGGLFLPFLDAAGGTPVRYGPDVPGVTSTSLDLHKYGYGAKGASVLLFADNALRHAGYHVDTTWPGGAYAASAVVGTRSVGPAAAAWTAMSALGVQGYRELVHGVMETTRRLQEGLAEVGLQVIGQPPMGVFAVTGDLSVPAVAKRLEERRWWIDTLDTPPAIHFVVFPRHAAVAEEFLADVRAAAEEAAGDDTASAGASYGVMIRGGELTDEVLREHLDERFTVQR